MSDLQKLQFATFASLFVSNIALLLINSSESVVFPVVGILAGISTIIFGVKAFMFASRELRENG